MDFIGLRFYFLPFLALFLSSPLQSKTPSRPAPEWPCVEWEERMEQQEGTSSVWVLRVYQDLQEQWAWRRKLRVVGPSHPVRSLGSFIEIIENCWILDSRGPWDHGCYMESSGEWEQMHQRMSSRYTWWRLDGSCRHEDRFGKCLGKVGW